MGYTGEMVNQPNLLVTSLILCDKIITFNRISFRYQCLKIYHGILKSSVMIVSGLIPKPVEW